MESIVHFYDYIRLQWRVSLTFMTVTYIVMECITHLYDHYNIMYSHKGAGYSPLQSKVVIKVSDTFHYNISYSHKGERYSPLQSNVFTFLTVPKIVFESIAHLYDCTLHCNEQYRSP
jgi:hypothetical protein